MTKAAIARKYEISPSTVNRILSGAGVPPSARGSTGTGKSTPEQSESRIQRETEIRDDKDGTRISELHSDLVNALLKLGLEDRSGIDVLVAEFHDWLRSRDDLEKRKLQDTMEIEALRTERARIEERIFELSTKAANLEMTIGRMRATAENAQVAMSLVEERLTNMEERMASNRDLLIIASGIKSLLDRGDIDDSTLAFITNFDDMWSPTTDEVRKRAKKALIRYVDMASSKLKKWKNDS